MHVMNIRRRRALTLTLIVFFLVVAGFALGPYFINCSNPWLRAAAMWSYKVRALCRLASPSVSGEIVDKAMISGGDLNQACDTVHTAYWSYTQSERRMFLGLIYGHLVDSNVPEWQRAVLCREWGTELEPDQLYGLLRTPDMAQEFAFRALRSKHDLNVKDLQIKCMQLLMEAACKKDASLENSAISMCEELEVTPDQLTGLDVVKAVHDSGSELAFQVAFLRLQKLLKGPASESAIPASYRAGPSIAPPRSVRQLPSSNSVR
jgi:hypothetical protein